MVKLNNLNFKNHKPKRVGRGIFRIEKRGRGVKGQKSNQCIN